MADALGRCCLPRSAHRGWHCGQGGHSRRSGPMSPGPRRRRTAGLTLLEVLAATVILAVGLVGVGSMVTYAVVAHNRAACYTIAAERATAEVERIRDAGYNGATVTTTLFPTAEYAILSATQASFTCSDLKGGHGVVTLDTDSAAKVINPNTGLPYSNLKRIDVQIWWQGTRGFSETYSVSTLLANRPK
jgi:Tfp pilus assembly protein PilV